MSNKTTKWYASWFNTSYYHLLYKDRDDSEAKRFMDTLTQHLSIQPEESILDLACGKGRHSRYLNDLGYTVAGVDLSENSILSAKVYENDRLYFDVHDMTVPYGKQFNFVFNLFTSFGYFENEIDNINTIKSIKENLKPNGIGIIDFFNAEQVIANLVEEEVKQVEHITFKIKRFVENGFIIKQIDFTDNGEEYSFQERVKAITLDDFKKYLELSGFTLLEMFGDYNLSKFNTKSSPRLILIFQ